MSITSDDFIGLSKHAAFDLAELNYLIFRLVSVNGELFLGHPEDRRDDRICVIIEDQKVIEAFIQ